jgi:RNA polymerase-binding transcription factor DksA
VSTAPAIRQPVSLNDPQETLRQALEQCRRDRCAQLALLDSVAVQKGDPVAVARLESARHVVAMIDLALARMHLGTYGVCVHCESPIPAARLEGVPYTDGCVDCLRRLPPGR